MDHALDCTTPARISPLTLLRFVWNLLPVFLVHAGAVGCFFVAAGSLEWWLLPVMAYVRGVFVTVGYHRYFAHRSFKTSRVAQFLMACGCCATLQQGPLWWAVFHRQHHRRSDKPQDPHSPIEGGFLWSYCGWLFIPMNPSHKTVSDLTRYPELVWLERFWQLPGLLLAGLTFWLGGWSWLCIDFCLSAVITFHMTFIVNSVAHLFGSRRYDTHDQSRNSLVLAVLTMGEGWHNNHHHYPHAARAGFFRHEPDGSYRIIKLLEFLGLVWDVREVPAHKLEPKPMQPTNILPETRVPETAVTNGP